MIETKEQYILTQDTSSLFAELGDTNALKSPVFTSAVAEYWITLQNEVAKLSGDNIQIIGYTEDEINTRLEEVVVSRLENNPDAVCVCLDRFLLSQPANPEILENRFYRFSMCRSMDGAKVPRQGYAPFNEQLSTLNEMAQFDEKEVIVVDDGYFTGGTIQEFADLATSNGIQLNIVETVGFIGNTAVESEIAIPSTILAPIDNMHEWVDIRDFSIFGGKLYQSGSTNAVTTSIPYLAPWSNGTGASISESEYLLEGSKQIITALTNLVNAYESERDSEDPLTFRELVRCNYPLPTNWEKTIPVSINDSVTEYLNRCITLIDLAQTGEITLFAQDQTDDI